MGEAVKNWGYGLLFGLVLYVIFPPLGAFWLGCWALGVVLMLLLGGLVGLAIITEKPQPVKVLTPEEKPLYPPSDWR